LNLRPDYAEVYDNLLVSMHYTDKADADALFEAHLEWSRRLLILPPRARHPRSSLAGD
jgi:hypothetical protein